MMATPSVPGAQSGKVRRQVTVSSIAGSAPRERGRTGLLLCAPGVTQTETSSVKKRVFLFRIKRLANTPYLIFASLNSTCFRATGSYFFIASLSVIVREFFLVT